MYEKLLSTLPKDFVKNSIKQFEDNFNLKKNNFSNSENVFNDLGVKFQELSSTTAEFRYKLDQLLIDNQNTRRKLLAEISENFTKFNLDELDLYKKSIIIFNKIHEGILDSFQKHNDLINDKIRELSVNFTNRIEAYNTNLSSTLASMSDKLEQSLINYSALHNDFTQLKNNLFLNFPNFSLSLAGVGLATILGTSMLYFASYKLPNLIKNVAEGVILKNLINNDQKIINSMRYSNPFSYVINFSMALFKHTLQFQLWKNSN